MTALRQLVSRGGDVFRLLEGGVANAARCADLLDEMVHHHPERRALAQEIFVSKQETNRIASELRRYVDRSFVTAVDPEEATELSFALEELSDLIERVAEMLAASGEAPARTEARRLTAVQLQAGRELERAVRMLPRLEEMPHSIAELRRLEGEGDRLAREAVSSLFAERPDPVELVRWKDIFDRLDRAFATCGRAATVLERMVARWT